jgi:hypothetical protein
MSAVAPTAGANTDSPRSFLLQRVQPAMTGRLIDGALSTLAPIFAVRAAATQTQPGAIPTHP